MTNENENDLPGFVGSARPGPLRLFLASTWGGGFLRPCTLLMST